MCNDFCNLWPCIQLEKKETIEEEWDRLREKKETEEEEEGLHKQ